MANTFKVGDKVRVKPLVPTEEYIVIEVHQYRADLREIGTDKIVSRQLDALEPAAPTLATLTDELATELDKRLADIRANHIDTLSNAGPFEIAEMLRFQQSVIDALFVEQGRRGLKIMALEADVHYANEKQIATSRELDRTLDSLATAHRENAELLTANRELTLPPIGPVTVIGPVSAAPSVTTPSEGDEPIPRPWTAGEVKDTGCPLSGCGGRLLRIGPDSYSHDVWQCERCHGTFSSGVGIPSTQPPSSGTAKAGPKLTKAQFVFMRRIVKNDDMGGLPFSPYSMDSGERRVANNLQKKHLITTGNRNHTVGLIATDLGRAALSSAQGGRDD